MGAKPRWRASIRQEPLEPGSRDGETLPIPANPVFELCRHLCRAAIVAGRAFARMTAVRSLLLLLDFTEHGLRRDILGDFTELRFGCNPEFVGDRRDHGDEAGQLVLGQQVDM